MADKLQRLIDSLDQREKSYIRHEISVGGKAETSVYVQIYDYYTGRKKIMVDEIRHYSRMKSYLIDLLEEILVRYHSGNVPGIRKRTEISRFEMMHLRGLLHEANPGKLIGRKDADAVLAIDRLNWIKRMSFSDGNVKGYRDAIDRQMDLMDDMNEYYRLEYVYCEVYELSLRKKEMSDRQLEKHALKLLKNPELKSNRKFRSPNAEILFCRILSILKTYCGDWNASYSWSKLRLHLLEQNKEIIESDPQNYINALSNIMEVSIRIKNDKAFLEYFKTLTVFQVKGTYMNARKEVRLLINRLLSSLTFSDYSELEVIAADFENLKAKYESLVRPDELLEIKYLLIAAYINTTEFKKAQKEIQLFFQIPKPEVRRDIQNLVRVLNVYVQFRLGNFEYLEYLVRNTYLYFRKLNDPGEPETIILDHFRKMKEEYSEAGIDNFIESISSRLKSVDRDELNHLISFVFIKKTAEK